VVRTGDEKILVRVSGAFRSEKDILAVNFVAHGRIIRLGGFARLSRGPADPAQSSLLARRRWSSCRRRLPPT